MATNLARLFHYIAETLAKIYFLKVFFSLILVYGLIIWRFALTLEPWLILSVLGAQEWLKKSVVG